MYELMVTKKQQKEWESDLLMEFIGYGREYDTRFFASMLIKLLWALEDG